MTVKSFQPEVIWLPARFAPLERGLLLGGEQLSHPARQQIDQTFARLEEVGIDTFKEIGIPLDPQCDDLAMEFLAPAARA